MTYYRISTKNANNTIEILEDLDKLLTDRIVDLAGVKGGMQARHAYVLYRSKVWEAKSKIVDSLVLMDLTEKSESND